MDYRFGSYFEELTEGTLMRHPLRKTVTESDNNLFCLLTMNHHPLHLDASYAQSTSFGERVVVGTYVLSLVVGLSVADISGKAIANLSYRDIQHHAPVFIGDTLRAETTILQARPSQSHPDAGIVEVETRAYKQDNTLVLSLRRTLMVPRREA